MGSKVHALGVWFSVQGFGRVSGSGVPDRSGSGGRSPSSSLLPLQVLEGPCDFGWVMQESMSLKYEPASKPLHISESGRTWPKRTFCVQTSNCDFFQASSGRCGLGWGWPRSSWKSKPAPLAHPLIPPSSTLASLPAAPPEGFRFYVSERPVFCVQC